MAKNEKLDNTRERLIRTYSNIRRNYEIILYLSSSNNRELNRFVDKNELLSHWRYLTFKDLDIEIVKAISVRMARGKSNYDFDGLLIYILINSELSYVSKKKLYIKMLVLKEAIKTIKSTRDKFYAHIDPEYEIFLGNQSLSDLEKIVFLIQDVMCKVFGNKEMIAILSSIPSSKDYTLHKQFSNPLAPLSDQC
jgi:hypothetical protein